MLLPLLTSLLLPAFGYPTSSSETLEVDGQHTMRVEFAFHHTTSGVPTPIRLHGLDTDRDVLVCDTPTCLQPQTIHVPAHAVVEVEAPTTGAGVVVGSIVDGSLSTPCCKRPHDDLVAAVVTDTLGAPAEPNQRNGEAVRITPVGRLFDEHAALLDAVPMVVLVDGDLNHSDAFFEGLQRFVRNGGILSVDAGQAARLGTHPGAAPTREPQERTIADDAGTMVVSPGRPIAGALHRIDGIGFVVVRPPLQPMREAVADLALLHSAVHGWTRGGVWGDGGSVVNAVLVGLQPFPGAGTAALWVMLFGAVAGTSAAFILRRRQAASPTHAALAVFAIATVAVGGALVASALTASVRRTEVVVQGPGAHGHDKTTIRAAVADVDGPIAAIAFDAPHAFVVSPYGRGVRHGADVAAVGIWHDVDGSPGWLEKNRDGQCTNHFQHDVILVGSPGGMLVPPGETRELMGSTHNVALPPVVAAVAGALREPDTAVAYYVDDAGISHFVVGTDR